MVTGRLYCLYQKPLIVDILPPTMSPYILALDGGGLEVLYLCLVYLPLVQEQLQLVNIHNVVKLAIGTSSGQSKSKFQDTNLLAWEI